MISLPEFRKLLGPSAATMTDAQVERIRACGYAWADAIFEWWLNKQKAALKGQDSRETGPAV